MGGLVLEITYLMIFECLNVLLVLASKFQSNFFFYFLSNILYFFVFWHGKFLVGSLRESLRVLVRKQQEVSLWKSLRSIMLHGFCLSILGVDRPRVYSNV